MSKSSFQNDVPWRASSSSAKPIPKIHHSPILRVSQNPFSDYAISIMRVSLFFTFHPLSSFKFSFLTFFFFFWIFCSIQTLLGMVWVMTLQLKQLVLNASYLVKLLPLNYLALRYLFLVSNFVLEIKLNYVNYGAPIQTCGH